MNNVFNLNRLVPGGLSGLEDWYDLSYSEGMRLPPADYSGPDQLLWGGQSAPLWPAGVPEQRVVRGEAPAYRPDYRLNVAGYDLPVPPELAQSLGGMGEAVRLTDPELSPSEVAGWASLGLLPGMGIFGKTAQRAARSAEPAAMEAWGRMRGAAPYAGGLLALEPGAAESAPVPKPFRSVLADLVARAPAKVRSGNEWLQYLQPGKTAMFGDVAAPLKKEELDWSGLKDIFARYGKAPVPRDELSAALKARTMPELRIRGDHPGLNYRTGNYFEPTLYDSYVTKGPQTNYQENLTKWDAMGRAPAEKEYDDYLLSPQAKYPDSIFKNITAEEDIKLEQLKKAANAAPFIPRAGHFDHEPNLLSHSRATVRTNPAGERVRYVEEIQSDWHQQAREEGYRINRFEPVVEDTGYGEPGTNLSIRPNIEDWAARGMPQVFVNYVSGIQRDAGGRYWPKGRWIANYGNELHNASSKEDAVDWAKRKLESLEVIEDKRPPRAPYSTPNEYAALELKKQLAQAIEAGDEYLAWSPGQEQIDRYASHLKQQVGKIDWTKTAEGKYDLEPLSQSGRPLGMKKEDITGLDAKQLRDLLGKEMADKILADKQAAGSLTGPDLTVGGAGMRHFYDTVIPHEAKRLAKQYGGELVETEIPLQNKTMYRILDVAGNERPTLFSTREAAESHLQRPGVAEGSIKEIPPYGLKTQAIRITPEMRERFKKAGGFPLYGTAGTAALPWDEWLGADEP